MGDWLDGWKEGREDSRKGKKGGEKEEKYCGDSLVIYSGIAKSSIFSRKQHGSANGNKQLFSLFSYSQTAVPSLQQLLPIGFHFSFNQWTKHQADTPGSPTTWKYLPWP